jgi:NAD(P)-dependent dehydrogenase (short-subunit alcohol dehydrogenase family)
VAFSGVSRETRPAVFLSGGSSGIGAAIALELVAQGYTVGCASRRGTTPEQSASLIPIGLDVTDDSAVREKFSKFAETFGLAGIVNVAGGHAVTPSVALELDELRRSLELNLISAVRLAQLGHPYLVARGGGFIANIGSFYADLGIPGRLSYAAAKAALASVTRTLAVEWASEGISVLNFAPGYVETELNSAYLADPINRQKLVKRIPVGRVGSAEEVGRLVGRILGADCSFLTGETITIDGAQGVRE